MYYTIRRYSQSDRENVKQLTLNLGMQIDNSVEKFPKSNYVLENENKEFLAFGFLRIKDENTPVEAQILFLPGKENQGMKRLLLKRLIYCSEDYNLPEITTLVDTEDNKEIEICEKLGFRKMMVTNSERVVLFQRKNRNW